METTPSANNGGLSADKTPSRTPTNRNGATTPSSRRGVHTPLDRSATRDLLNSIRRGTPASARRNNAPTPHAKAARRALHDRRTAIFTPGKKRRRSLMAQREDAMDILKNLGRALAPTSQPISSSSSSSSASASGERRKSARITQTNLYDDDLDDELPIDQPRLSLPIDQDDDDDDLRPPRSSGVEREDYTLRSIEFPRRELASQPLSRLSRGSFGSVQGSDNFVMNDVTQVLGRNSDFFGDLPLHLHERPTDNMGVERIDGDPTVRSVMDPESNFDLEMPVGLDDPSTFIFEPPQPSPSPARSVAEATATVALDADNDAGVSDQDEFPDREPIENFSSSDDDRHSVPDDNGFPLPDDSRLSPRLSPEDVGGDQGASDIDITATTALPSGPGLESREAPLKALRKQKRISRHGIDYSALPPAFVKRVAQTALQNSGLSNTRISADTLAALTQASEWFFEQLGDDLEAYASHAKRKTIEESDVVTLMRRQRQIGSNATVFSQAQKHLPRELLQELRMPMPQPVKKRRPNPARDENEGAEDT